MHFQLRALILWSRDGEHRRVVRFTPGVVNVITGASKTGKSAVVPIVDYCLASDKCAIPVGVIRERCSWFGILVETLEGQKLFARREPGDQQQTGDMFVVEGETVEIPMRIEQKNSNTDAVKQTLSRIAGLSQLGLDPQSDSGFRARPSFRDLVAFTFQPQNVIANPDVMFFKADTTEHREKLKSIFPYVLNALSPDVLARRWEIDRLQRVLRRKQAELDAVRQSVRGWTSEALGWVSQAKELGLIESIPSPNAEWTEVVDALRGISLSSSRSTSITSSSVDFALNELQQLRKDEAAAASELSEHRQKLNELRRLTEASVVYASATRIQRDRLAIVDWLRQRAEETSDALAVLGGDARADLEVLFDALGGSELQLRSQTRLSQGLEKEMLRLRGSTEQSVEKLVAVRQRLNALERRSERARAEAYRLDRIERFLGRLEQALKVYDQAGQNSELQEEIATLNEQLSGLRDSVSEFDITRRLENAVKNVENYAEAIIPELDAEWPGAPIKLIISELTIKVVQGTRDDFLWEIGSGANWLAYHVALTLALQRFFLSVPNHPVPGLLVYDQPSQVYFPRRLAAPLSEEENPVWKDDDVAAVRKVFVALANEVLRAKGRLQILALDHAGEDVWGGIEGVVLTEDWHENKLVPDDWTS
jgi:hypothetical protein